MTRAREISNVLGRNIESTTFTATAGQTAFSITHAAGRIQVYMNGLLLDPTVDWTSDGSTVTLTEGAVAGDELEVVKFDNLAVADAIPRTGHTGTIDFSDATFTPPAGHVMQTKYSKITQETAFNTASYTDATNFSVTITPTSANSIIRICIFTKTGMNNTSVNSGQDYRLLRGSTDIDNSNWMNYLNRSDYTADYYPPFILDVIDLPNTTSATTYKLQGRTYSGSGAPWNVGSTNGGSHRGYMIVQEIAQ